MKKIYRGAPIIFLVVLVMITELLMWLSQVSLPKQDSDAVASILIALIPFLGIAGAVYFGIWGENKLDNLKEK